MPKNLKLLTCSASCVLLLLLVFHSQVTEAQAVARTISLSPDGSKIAYLDTTGTLVVVDAFAMTQLLTIKSPVNKFDSFAWRPDSTQLATNSHLQNDGVRIWNAEDGSSVAHLEEFADLAEGSGIVAWAPDGTKIASGQLTPTGVLPVHIWSSIKDDFSLLSTVTEVGQIYNMAWSPDSSQLAIAEYRGLFIVNDLGGTKPKTHKLPYSAYNLAWGPDSTQLALITLLPSLLDSDGIVHIVSLQEPPKEIAGLPVYAIDLAWSKNGNRLAVGAGNELQIWDPNTGQELASFPSTGPSMSWSPFGGRILYLAKPANGISSKMPFIQGGIPKFGIPAPTLSVLQNVLAQCAPPTAQRQLSSLLNKAQLTDFSNSVRQLTGTTLTAACGDELAAIADSLKTQ